MAPYDVAPLDIPPAVTRYLRRVTWLVPGAARQAIREELLGNLYQTRLDAQCAGYSEAEAWAVALRSAGPAFSAALGFARVHTLGLLLRWLLVGAALGGAAYAVQNQGGNVVSVTSQVQPQGHK